MALTQLTIFKTSLRYGVYTSVAIIIFLFSAHLLNIGLTSGVQSLLYVLLLIGIAFSLKDIRNRNQNNLKYKQRFALGMYISFITGLSKGIFYFFYFSFFNNSWLKQKAQSMLNYAKRMNFTDKEMEISKDIISIYMSPGGMILNHLLDMVMIGIIFSLILSFVINKL